MRKNNLLFFCLLLFISGAFFFLLENSYGLVINRSESLSTPIFYSKKLGTLEKEMTICFKHPKFPSNIGKKIKGLPGDRIEVRDRELYINGKYLCHVKSVSSTGIHYSPILSQVIPEGYLYVHGDHPESFDSRYSEFGLVEISWLKEELCPIF